MSSVTESLKDPIGIGLNDIFFNGRNKDFKLESMMGVVKGS